MVNKDKLLQLAADILFPECNACHLCGRALDGRGILCAECLAQLNSSRFKRLRSASQEAHPPLKSCLSAFPHRDEARRLVHLLKYQADASAAELLGEAMAAALVSSPERPEAVSAVVPVPLHKSRFRQRGYNQAQLLAQAVCSRTGMPLEEGLLIRLRATDTQLSRGREQRMQAMARAFHAPDPRAVRGRHILLVDDVLTTGATAVSCAQTLLEAGAAEVSLLTACRA